MLERHGWRPAKRLGQHFLTSKPVVRAVVAAASGCPGVLEVGPGPGVLTGPLSEAASVVAVEIDPLAVAALAESAPRARVVQSDALRTDLGALLRGLPKPRALVSNMPYQITGPLLEAFAGVAAEWEVAVLMMQKEVGERVCAKPGAREFGSLSLDMQNRFEISRVAVAPAGAFYPPPKVDSVVLRFAARPGVEPTIADVMERLGRIAFAQPRKTLANNLAAVFGRARADAALASAGLDPMVRPHQVDFPGWDALLAALRDLL